jgi:molecular chaperone DnaK (HSP70)
MRGTLAIDLGSSTTVVAFQPEGGEAELLALPPYSLERPVVVPSLLWLAAPGSARPLIGRQVLEAGLADAPGPQLHRDFKRQIGAGPNTSPGEGPGLPLSPDEAGALLLRQLWQALPAGLDPQRLVLTAPIDTYRPYRRWLLELGQALGVAELALVDEPTAAAIGAGLPAGSTVLVVDLGGGTIDLSLVRLQGGQGRAAPIAQLLRFAGRNLEQSRQSLRCAEVLGKAGLPLGGRDIDRWIAAELLGPITGNAPTGEHSLPASLLAAAEQLKCQLSTSEEALVVWSPPKGAPQPLHLSRARLETLLEERGLVGALDGLLADVLAAGRREGVGLEALSAGLLVGGSSRMPWIQRWLEQRCPGVPIRGERPVEAVALGALALTPGVRVRDVLSHGVALRCWDRRSSRHHWHPLFVAGQSWPTQQPLTLVLACSQADQQELELVLGEPEPEQRAEVLFSGGLPQLRPRSAGTARVKAWSQQPAPIRLEPPGQPGEDRLQLAFQLNGRGELEVEICDLRSGDRRPSQPLGPVR